MLAGLLSHIPGVDFGMTIEMSEVNISGVQSLIGFGIWRCDHLCRRILLVILHLPGLGWGILGYELLSQFLSPIYSGATKNISTFGEGAYLALIGILVFTVAYVPALVLSDRKVKLLFAPSRGKKGLPKVDREKVKPSVSRKTIPAVALVSASIGLLLAVADTHEEMEFQEISSFQDENKGRLDYVQGYALMCSRLEAYTSYQADSSEMEGSGWHVWMEPAFSAEKASVHAKFGVWPPVTNRGEILEPYSYPTPLPHGYEFSFPVLYDGEAFDETSKKMVPVQIYRDWVHAPGSEMPLQVIILMP